MRWQGEREMLGKNNLKDRTGVEREGGVLREEVVGDERAEHADVGLEHGHRDLAVERGRAIPARAGGSARGTGRHGDAGGGVAYSASQLTTRWNSVRFSRTARVSSAS